MDSILAEFNHLNLISSNNINESDRKKSPNTSGDSLENPLNTENEPVSVSR